MMRVPPELEKLLPKPEECTPSTVSAAMRYLAHDWLSDVATDFTGRATVIAMALSACHSGPVQGARGYGVFRL